MEEDKLLLLEFIQSSGLHLPKPLRTRLQGSVLQTALTHPPPSSRGGKSPSSNSKPVEAGVGSFGQEVDVQVLPSKSATVTRVDTVGHVSDVGDDRGGNQSFITRRPPLHFYFCLSVSDKVEQNSSCQAEVHAVRVRVRAREQRHNGTIYFVVVAEQSLKK